MEKQIFENEIVAIFDNLEGLDNAIDELKSKKFPRHNISILGTHKDMIAVFGDDAVLPEYAEDNPETPKAVSIKPEERTIGGALLVGVPAYIGGCFALFLASSAPIPVLLAAIAVGSIFGAILGGMALLVVYDKFRKKLEKQIDRGGLPLWVKTFEAEREKIATQILSKHGGHDVHIVRRSK